MKKLPLILVILLTGLFTNAQFVYKIPKALQKKSQLPGVWKNPFPGVHLDKTFITKNENGSIYALSLDHMPCLVPDIDTNKNIPNAVQIKPATVSIPNPFALQTKPWF
jgi:hypothetical protein